MRILVIRPEPEAQRFAAQLREHGIDAVIAPMLAIASLETPLPPLDGVQALVFTSANGVRAYAARGGRTDLPAYAVGEATAAAARGAGFAKAISAGADWEGLAALLAADLDPAKGRLLHPTGEDQAGQLAVSLRDRGFEVTQAVLYRAAAVPELPGAARAALTAGAVDGVALFSPRSAAIFAERTAAAGLADRLAHIDAYCISRAVAEALELRSFRAVRVAARPNAEALIALIRAERNLREDRESADAEAGAGATEAERIVAAFGGIRPMAKALGIAVTTVQGWKERGAIPLRRMDEIRDAAARLGIDLTSALAGGGGIDETPRPEHLRAVPPGPEPKPESVSAERVSPAPEPGLRAAEAPPPPPPLLDASPPARDGRWRWAMMGAGFGAAFVVGAILAALIGLGGSRSPGEAERQALDRMQSRIDRLTSQLEEQQKRQQGEAAALQTRLNRIDAAERAIGEQRERVASVAASVAALASRLERLDADAKALAARAPAPPEEMASLKAELGALAKRIESLPKEAPDLSAIAGQIKQLADGLAALERRVSEIVQARPGEGDWKAELDRRSAEARAAGEKLTAETERLKQELAALQARTGTLAAEMQRLGSTGDGRGALVVAVGQLRQAVLEGVPYRPALDAVAAMAKDRQDFAPALAVLDTRADKGVPTTAQLRLRFERTAIAVVRAGTTPTAQDDVWDRIWARLQTLVSVRRIGDVPGESAASRVSRAEAALARGDLAGAAKEMEALGGLAREAAAGWIVDAKARLEADVALAALDRGALALMRPPATKAQP